MHRENVNPPAWHATGRTVRARFLLLILDPEPEGIRAFAAALEDRQIDVVMLDDPATALIQAGAILPDAILTAAQVPPMRGSDIARVVTAYGGIPVLVGVGEHDGPEASLALANGARVCVPRPYRVVDVLPMLRAISPDTVADFHVTVEVGGLRLDPAAVEVQHRGRRISLPMREFQLLHLLMLHAGAGRHPHTDQPARLGQGKRGGLQHPGRPHPTATHQTQRRPQRPEDHRLGARNRLPPQRAGPTAVQLRLARHSLFTMPSLDVRNTVPRLRIMSVASHASDRACAPGPTQPPLPRTEAEQLARWLKALSDPTRLQILSLINATPAGELCVCDLTESFDVTQPAISHHLKVLVDGGVLQREKRGSWAWYSVVPAQADAIRRVLPA